jgi:ligand-binding SRPBCC domain-containing protein
MKLYRLERSQRLAIPRDQAWTFFSDPRNLPRITPPWMAFRITNRLAERMHPGMIITYQVRVLPGLAVDWVTEITHVGEPEFFVDEQRFGPYRFWHHQHHFREIPGGTEVQDVVHYALPLDPAGRLVRQWLVAPRLERIFDFRSGVLRRRFGEVE